MDKLTVITALAVATMGGGRADAGGRRVAEVRIDATSASGSLGSARNSGDTSQYIGCSVTGDAGLSYAYGTCTARNALGEVRSCWSTSISQMDAIHGLNGDSWISFTWGVEGDCKTLQIENSSIWEPKR